jgi:hypothetical protein
MADNKITLSKPYEFEGHTYTEIDMSGIYDLKSRDLSGVDKIFIAQGNNPALAGLSLEYAEIVAHKVTGLPVEFFPDLPAKDAIKLKNFVSNFFFSEA